MLCLIYVQEENFPGNFSSFMVSFSINRYGRAGRLRQRRSATDWFFTMLYSRLVADSVRLW